MNLLDLFLLPARIMLNALGEHTPTPTQLGLHRQKKQETMRKYPDSFDKDGNFTGNKKTGKAY